jgi:transposase
MPPAARIIAGERAMTYFVGLDVSKQTTSICIMDRDGKVVREGVVETSPKAIVGFLRGERRRYVRVGLEAGGMAGWLYQGLTRKGLPVVVIETRHAHAMLKGHRNKTDRNDAKGIANLMRTASYRKVHVKSQSSLEIQVDLTARRLLVDKARDITGAIRGVLLSAGLKLAAGRRHTFEQRVYALLDRHPFVENAIRSLMTARAALLREMQAIEAGLIATASDDPVCRRLMTAPGVGAITALTYRSAIDEPHRFARSRAVGAHFGLTSGIWQTGETLIQGRITKWGDGNVRRALVLAAWQLLRSNTRRSWLSALVMHIAEHRGAGRAVVAGARRLAIVLHRMWVTETDFRWEASPA